MFESQREMTQMLNREGKKSQKYSIFSRLVLLMLFTVLVVLYSSDRLFSHNFGRSNMLNPQVIVNFDRVLSHFSLCLS